MRIDMPVPGWARVAIAAFGLVIVGLPIWELSRGVWPPSIFSPFFLFIILGACTLGVPAIRGGIAGWEESWTITAGRIELRRRNPFASRLLVFTAADVARMEVVEHAAMEGDSTFSVMVATAAGHQYDTQRRFGSRRAAESFADEMRTAFAV